MYKQPWQIGCLRGRLRLYVLMFDKDMGNAIQKACTLDLEVLQAAKTAQLLRREIFKSSSPFSGAFESRSHHNSELFWLKTLGMISMDQVQL